METRMSTPSSMWPLKCSAHSCLFSSRSLARCWKTRPRSRRMSTSQLRPPFVGRRGHCKKPAETQQRSADQALYGGFLRRRTWALLVLFSAFGALQGLVRVLVRARRLRDHQFGSVHLALAPIPAMCIASSAAGARRLHVATAAHKALARLRRVCVVAETPRHGLALCRGAQFWGSGFWPRQQRRPQEDCHERARCRNSGGRRRRSR